MIPAPYAPIFTLTRGDTIESIHYGAIAVADANGNLVAKYGDPYAVTFLRSTAKPLQVLAFLEEGGQTKFDLTDREIALLCASHSGTDEHVKVAKTIAHKISVHETDLLCGVHLPIHQPSAHALIERGEQPTPYRHNCSGKHLGMLAYARLKNQSLTDYINPQHPIQRCILQTVAEMCALSQEQIAPGTDGCSAPNFALPLYNTARALAKLCAPQDTNPPLTAQRRAACRSVTTAMISYPNMVGGPNRFDTQLMETMPGRLICKGGAEGYQGIGLLPGALGHDSPGLGIAFKISDGDLKGHSRPAGDPRGHARPAVALEILSQLGAISSRELDKLAQYGPRFSIQNWRKLVVGEARPCFKLNFEHRGPEDLAISNPIQ